jgi:UDP-N-acetylglucosamine 2-epimerase (non-hydrolysing)
MAPLMVECQSRAIPYNFIFLAQHHKTIYEMLEQFGVKKPDHVIGDVGHDITSASRMVFWSARVMIQGIRQRKKLFNNDKSGIALVHGDAPPLLLGALMARVQGLKVAHIESGLRSFNFRQPFPEELTRVLFYKLRLGKYFFCQDDWSMSNLAHVPGTKINIGVNTLIDSLRIAVERGPSIKVDIPSHPYALASLHRFESISNAAGMTRLVDILENIAHKVPLLFVLHPPTEAMLRKLHLFERLSQIQGIELRPRYSYFEFIKLLNHSEFLVSDGGSNQEECFYMGKPCLLLRSRSERNEGLGTNCILSKFDASIIKDFLDSYQKLMNNAILNSKYPSRDIIDYLVTIDE